MLFRSFSNDFKAKSEENPKKNDFAAADKFSPGNEGCEETLQLSRTTDLSGNNKISLQLTLGSFLKTAKNLCRGKKTQVPEPSRESNRKTGSAKHCPKPRFLFISRRISGTDKASDPFHTLPFGKAEQSSRYTLTAPGLSCPDITIHPLFCNVKLVLPNF